jgi:phosphoglycerate kinase
MDYPLLRNSQDISGKRVITRLDFNVPIQNGKITDDYRIQHSLKTINFLREKQAKIIIISHIETGTDTLRPVYDYLKNELSLPIEFCEDCVENGGECIEKMKPGEILLCENLRLYDGEKKNDEEFARKLAALGDLYVNDAFSVSHRKHASVVGIPKFLPSYLGFQFEEEIKHLSECFNPPHPFLFILGGAKFETKLPLVERFLAIADTIFIGGALAHDVLKAKGVGIGGSKTSDVAIDFSHFIDNPKIMLPIDVVVDSNGVHKTKTLGTDTIELSEKIFDAGPATMKMLEEKVAQSVYILWNGTLGMYEGGYKEPTLDLARMIAAGNAKSIVGGGDTLAAISELKLEDKFTFVSTGGGAMLDFLAEGTLPGLEAVTSSKKS